MTALVNHTQRCKPVRYSRRRDEAQPTDVSSESLFIQSWIAQQSDRYADLLRTIASAPQPVKTH